MNSDDDDTEEAEVNAATDKMAQQTSDIPGTGDVYTRYERRAQQYLQLSNGGKALANAVKAVEYRNDSFTAHWLAGKSYISMAMYDPGIRALSTAIDLCCLEEKRQEILIDLLVHYCSRRNKLLVETGVLGKISGHTWATVAYELTKTRRFNAAYIAYTQLQKVGQHPPDIDFDLQPLCDLDSVTAEPWILDLVMCFLRYGSDHNTMSSQAGDTYIHVVVRMSLAAGVLGLLEYVLGNKVRPGELRGLLDCLRNTALHMAAQCQKCSPLLRIDVMTLLVKAGVDETAKNIEGKTAGSYLLRDEKDFLQCHQKYNSICSGMTATKMKQAVNKIYDNVDIARSEDDIEELQDSTQDDTKVQERGTTKRTIAGTLSPQTCSKEDDKPDNNTVEDTTNLFLQKRMERLQMVTVGIQEGHKYNDCCQSLVTLAEENSFQDKTTNNQEQPVPATEEEEKPLQEPPISVFQDIDEESSRNLNIDGQITSEYIRVESVPNKQKPIEFNLVTNNKNSQNHLQKQQGNQLTDISSNECDTKNIICIRDDVFRVNINADNVNVNVVKTSNVSDDVGDDSPTLGQLEHNDNGSPKGAGTSENESDGREMEFELSLNESITQSSQNSFTLSQSPDLPKDRAACAELQCGNTDDDNDDIDYTTFPHVQANLFEAITPDDNDIVSARIVSVQTNNDRDDDDIQIPPNETDSPQTGKKAKNESNSSEAGQDVTRNEIMAKSSQETVTQSQEFLKKSPKVSKNRVAFAELQCSSTAEKIVHTSFNKDNLLEPISPDDNADKNVRITSCQEHDDRDDSSSPVSTENIDNNNPQTGKTPENDSSCRQLGSNVSCNEIMSKSSRESISQQDVLLDEITSKNFLRDSTGAFSAVDMFSNDNDVIFSSGEQDVIDHHTVEVDEQKVSVTSDTPSASSKEQFDDTSTADDDGCEREHRLHAHFEKKHLDHGKEKLSITTPRSRDNPTETREKQATECKTLSKKLKSLYKDGKSWLEIKLYTKGFAVFGKLLQSAPALSTNKYISKTINHFCTNLDDTGDSDIPADLIQVPDSHLNQILKGLLDRRKWFPFLSIVRKHREINTSKEKFMDHVNEICLGTVVGDQQFLRNTKRLDNLMRGLLDIGANISNEGQNCIHACIKNAHYRILPLLLSRGAHPRHLTIYSGDTPVHAALTIALQKGHFEAFELLLTKFQEYPQVYNLCDPTSQDKNGDGLLHLALRQPDGSHSRRAIGLLIQHIRNPSSILSTNKKGQHPLDLIRGKYDSRWGILEPLFCCIPTQLKRQKAAHNRKRKFSSDVNNAMNKTVVSDTDFRVTTQECPSNESERIDFDSEISVEDKKISVAAFPVRKDNMFEEIRERTKEKDVPQEDEKKEANLLQERNRDGIEQRKKETKEDEVSEKETDKEEKQQGDGNELLMSPYTKGKLKDTECKEVAEDDGTMRERIVEETYDMRQERGFDRVSEKTNLTKSEVQNAGSAFIHEMQEDEKKNQEKERGRQDRVDETMDGAEEEDDDGDCNDNDEEMAICATKKHMNGGNEDDNLAMNQDEPADRTSNEFLDQISSELDDLPWEVECTKSFVKTMTSKINSTIKNKIMMTISKLAKGDWHQSICKELHSVHKPKNTQLYESKIGKGCRLIWQRAITFSSKLSATTVNTERQTYRNKKISGKDMYSEVIRIWNYVSNHDDIHKYVVNICSALKNENQEDFKRDPKPPSTFQRTLPSYFGSDSMEIGVLRPPVKVANEEFQIVKFYTFSPDMLKHIHRQSSLNVDFPFRITDLEHSIINLESDAPILLIGRSGTGKTTCCLYRLWHQFIAHLSIHCELQELAKQESGSENCHGEHNQAADSDKDVRHPCKSLSAEPEDDKQHMLDDSVLLNNRLHQIFVTRNRLLCSEAKRNFNEMKHGSSIAQKFGLCDDSPLPWHFDDIRDSQYPLFLTWKQLLILMDASVGPNFFYARESNGSLKGRKRSLFEEDSSISGITEHMRKGGIVVHNETSKSKEASKLPTEVTYEVFCDIVWPKIATNCKYQPLLVWMEFISIIKGSYEALLQPKGYLSREMYLVVGRKRAPNFDGNRDEIYDLFQKYQKFSEKKNLFDECDLINSVKSRLQPQHVKAWAIHQLFVDEIQDFTQAELCLLIKICQDPNQMFLTGDTAQTVMHGIEFRFCDLKSLFFNIREAMKADGVQGKYLVEVPGKVHQLTNSYRSHDGILSLASSILDIMTHLFPDSFDHLQADKSLIQGGPLPVLLESSNFSDLVRHISDNKEETEDTADIELGVHQAILVINETARQQLPRQLQQNITLTIYESKGLEFNNIFIFNFFKFSQASKEWRAVTSLLTELTQNDTDTTNSRTGVYELDEGKLHKKGRPRALKFDPKLHKVLNSELKLLYTAVTRARVNVWIFDEDEENRRPMFDYFQARNLVSVKTERFTKDYFNEPASENDEWLARGKDFMKTRVYREAAKCFKKGGYIKLVDIANAHHSEVIARNVRDQASRKTKFLQTAELYCKCGFHSEAMECYEEAGAFKAAAEYCDSIGKFEEAAKIYKKRVNNPVKSSDCYQKAHLFDTAVKVLYESGHYEKALDVVSRYDKQLKEMESENKIIPQLMKNHHPCKQYNWVDLIIKCAELYHREHEYDKMTEHLGHLSFDEHRNVLLQWGHIDLTVDLMKTKGKYEEASRLYLSKGRSKDALAIARESGNDENIAQYLLRDIQGEICNHQVPDKSQTSDRIQELFELLSVIKTNRKLQGQAYLLKAELNGGIAKEVETALSKALGAFKQCDPPCKAGQIDCLNLMLKNLTPGNISSVVEEMHTLFDVIKLFEKTASTKDDSQTIKLICSHFGYEYSTDGLLLTKSCQHHLDPEIKRKCKSENEREVKKAIGIVLKELAHEWYTKIRSSMKKWMENQTCSKLHYSHLRCGCLKKLLETDLLHIELDGYLAGTLKGISITAQKSIETSLEPCNTFLRHLLPQQFIKRSSKEEWYALADVLRKTKRTVKERLMTALKVEYDYITQKKRKRSTNLFMKLHFLVKYLKLDMKPQEMMKTFEQDLNDELSRKENKQKVLGKIRHLGFLIHPEPIRCLAVRFVEAYDNISYYMDPMEALVKFTAFLRLLRGYDQEVLPDCNYLIMWMEYFLVVASYMAAKADNQISFLLPNSYTHVTHYIDSSFDSENKATINAVVRTGKKLNLHVIQNRIEAIALFLCEDGDKNKLMNAAFSSENTDFEVSERLVMLSLTCMCNIERMGTTSSEQLLLGQLSSIQLHTDAPPRLKDAIKTLKTAKGLLDVGNLFRRLLFERGEELHTYSFYKGNVLSKPLTILNDILPDTFHEDAARSQLQPQETDTTKESTNI